MPEGDTVWLAARRLDEALGGAVITGCDFRVPQLATATLAGSTVINVVPRGKHLLFRFDDGRTLHTHFRMDGTWHLYRPGTPWRGGPLSSVRLILRTEAWEAVGYRLPIIDLLDTRDEARVVGHLGPDILGSDWEPGPAVERLRRDPSAEIGVALLEQRNLAGIGNLYKCESLFIAGVSPWRTVQDVDDLAGLVTTAHRLLDRNKARPSQSTTGEEGYGRTHFVFERAGRQCRRCGATIRRARQGAAPADRATYWCGTCQAD